MGSLVDRLQQRLVPALLAALGVSFVAAGLLSYMDPVVAVPPGSDAPSTAVVSPGPGASALLTFPPIATSSPSASASPSASRVATRVVVPALDIDLPVIKQPGGRNTFPPCNVAMYLTILHQPGEPGATYLYAHARTGMFLPILEASRVSNGKRMLGMLVQVYTSDDQLYLYEVTEVRRHVTKLDRAIAEKRETLWLQTSEGPVGTIEKVQLVAIPIDHGPADHKDANPRPKPVFCR